MSDRNYNIDRFYREHRLYYDTALREMKNGRKVNHWIWFIFPQLRFLGRSHNARFYGMEDKQEARLYYEDEYLGRCLREITYALLECKSDDPVVVMGGNGSGNIDAKKLQSSMTLFYEATGDELFAYVLDKFYDGKKDEETVSYLKNHDG